MAAGIWDQPEVDGWFDWLMMLMTFRNRQKAEKVITGKVTGFFCAGCLRGEAERGLTGGLLRGQHPSLRNMANGRCLKNPDLTLNAKGGSLKSSDRNLEVEADLGPLWSHMEFYVHPKLETLNT